MDGWMGRWMVCGVGRGPGVPFFTAISISIGILFFFPLTLSWGLGIKPLGIYRFLVVVVGRALLLGKTPGEETGGWV